LSTPTDFKLTHYRLQRLGQSRGEAPGSDRNHRDPLLEMLWERDDPVQNLRRIWANVERYR
jgi:hypothetical protein